MKEKDDFLEVHKESMEALGFWTDWDLPSIIFLMEKNCKPEVIRKWYISNLILKDKKVLIKWNKRIFPLTQEELEKYKT